MTPQQLTEAHSLLTPDPASQIVCANFLLSLSGSGAKVPDPNYAYAILWGTLQTLLDEDKYSDAALLLWGVEGFNPKPRAVRMIWGSITENDKTLLIGAGSQGKCLGKGTQVLMFDGSIKNVEDIHDGDQVMGDDSTARNVTGVIKEFGKMFEVVPVKGKPWKCNEHHILSLKSSMDHMNGSKKSFSSNYTKGKVVDIPIRDFIAKSKTFKEHFKQYSEGVCFKNQAVDFDAYIYGLWLGDGGVTHGALTNKDEIIIKTWCEYFQSIGYQIRKDGGVKRCASYCPTLGGAISPWRRFFKNSCHGKEKRIRKEYLINDRDKRLKLLAGLIDTDGWAQDCGFGIVTKWAGLRDDIMFLARSLGYSATTWSGTKRIKSIGFEGIYHTIRISGQDTAKIPTLLKKVTSQPKRNPTCTSISIRVIPDDEYFGFQLDGNHRFLLGDFTVTHNTYTPAKWGVLDWVRDPQYTTVKVVSTSEKHAKSNVFSAMTSGFKESAIMLPGTKEMTEGWIGLDKQNRHASIELVAISVGEDNRATLQGFHPRPRPLHPQFGIQTRVRIFIDEAEKVGPTAWKGVDNALGNVDERGTIKVCAGTNPEDKETPFGQRVEPIGGWQSIDLETSEEWESKEGWHVVRLDAAKSENVIQKKEVFPGMMSYQGYMNYVKKGTNSGDYFTFARGWYPEQGADFSIIPPYALNDAIGTYVFVSPTVNIGSLDPAFELGGDNAMFTTGRTGMASGFQPLNGKYKEFDHPIKVIQVEQQFMIPKGNTQDMGAYVKKLCIDLRIRPENFVLDQTGNAKGIYDYLVREFGDVLGIKWGEAATDKKILQEDSETAEELYSGVMTEMWFAASRWLEYGYIKFAPLMQTNELFSQFTGRRYKYRGLLQQAESKDSFKLRTGGRSCDESDSCIMSIHLLRMREAAKGAMLPDPFPVSRDEHGMPIWKNSSGGGVIDDLEFIEF